jgi:glyoxylase-like metal-dependent hydrolase (beta-lactamase superfamily II)
MIVKSVVVEPFAENSLLVGCRQTGRGVLIDPGGRVPELLELASEGGLTVTEIWLTHAHIDHVSGVADAVAATGAPIRLHPADRQLYDHVDQQAAMFGLPMQPLPEPDLELVPGETLELGALRAEVLFVPGHSPGHVAFWFAGEGVVIAGDCLFAGSIGRTDLPGGSYETLMASIREQLLPLGDHVRVLAGHGPETTIGREKESNPFLTGRYGA